MTREQWEALNPIIFDRLRITGYLTEHDEGNTGQNKTIAAIDEFEGNHGYNTSCYFPIITPDSKLIQEDVRSASYSGIIEQLRECIVNDVDIISLSMSGEPDRSDLRKAIEDCEEAGIVVVCSSGNNGEEVDRYPAAYPTTISCGAIDNNLTPSDFHNYGDSLTCVNFGQNMPVKNKDGNWVLKTGTSFSTPLIAATIALIMNKYNLDKPYQVRDYIKENCVDLFEKGKDDKTGYGLLTCDTKEVEYVQSVIFGWENQDLSWRVLEIKSEMIENNLTLEEAEAKVNPNYELIYYDADGAPVYGGRRW